MLDCLIIGGGPAGLASALYLARFRRRALLVDAGDPRAAWIPTSHNAPGFPEGITGPALLDRQREHARRYGAAMKRGEVTALARTDEGFLATIMGGEAPREVFARFVILASGSKDVEPALPDLPDAVRRGLVRYCPICDGYEAAGERVAVIGHGAHGVGEALFLARTYGGDLTLLTLGEGAPLSDEDRGRLAAHRVALVEDAVTALDVHGGRIAALRVGGGELRFDSLYSALGLDVRSGLAAALGAARDASGALTIDAHSETSVPGLYAAGDVAPGLKQLASAFHHAAVAATAIHNRAGATGIGR